MMFPIDNKTFRAKAFNPRIRFLVLHYTAVNFKGSVAALTGPSVSAHYLIPDPLDDTYLAAGFKDMRIFNLVDENDRAWHAGVSAWGTRNNINDTSIGIEIVNLATTQAGVMVFPPFNPQQIEAVKQLAGDILQRYPDITPVNVVGHSDIAPGRKSDPGPAFPWEELFDSGIGAWYDCITKHRYQMQFEQGLPAKAEIVKKLSRYGYDIAIAQSTAGYQQLIRAFQLHFRPQDYAGQVDAETAAILYALVDKYFPPSR